MYLHLALPDRSRIDKLMQERSPGCVTIYLATDEIGENQCPRLALAALWRDARSQLEAAGLSKQELLAMDEVLNDLDGDLDFWLHQARSLALFVTPDGVATFQLPNHLADSVHVSDRFHLKPLLRSLTFTKAA